MMDEYDGRQSHKTPHGFIACLILLGTVACAGLIAYKVMSDSTKLPEEIIENEEQTIDIQEPDTDAPIPERIYSAVTMDNSAFTSGTVILVNNDYIYTDSEEEMVSIYDIMSENPHYHVSDMEVCMSAEAVSALDQMLNAYYEATGDSSVMCTSAYRTFKKQEQLYKNDLRNTGSDSSTLVAKPGYSEHQTGLSLDFSTFSDGVTGDFDGTGNQEWFAQHCAEYGFILRYPENKIQLTQIKYEPWHFRYVGIPTASVIMEQNWVLEEYIEVLNHCTYSQDHFVVTLSDGSRYEAYTVPVDTTGDTTNVAVPAEGEYSISGNNTNGFIVISKLPADCTLEDTDSAWIQEILSGTDDSEEDTEETDLENSDTADSDYTDETIETETSENTEVQE